MNRLAPVLGWLFAWSPNDVMAQGERGLAVWLKRQAPKNRAEPAA